jgi:cytochrome c biogenesis protein CcdA
MKEPIQLRATPAPRRWWPAVAVTVAVLIVSILGGLAATPGGTGPTLFVERLSSSVSNALSRSGASLPLGYAFVAGSIAAFNPCGFALLPAYLGLYVGEKTGERAAKARLARALAVSLAVAIAFTVLFGAVGIVVRGAAATVGGLLPWLGIVVGVALVALGGYLLSGGSLESGVGNRIADRLGRVAGSDGFGAYVAFGLAYGLASLGCTLPVFLAVTGTAVSLQTISSAMLQFVLFGLGMATTLAVLTVAVGLFSAGVLSRWRWVGRRLPLVSSGLLLIAGAYVIYYWLSLGRTRF